MTLWISFSRPITGSSLFSRAKTVRSRPNSSSVGVGFLVGVGVFFFPDCGGRALVVAASADLQDRLTQAVGGDVVPREVAGHDAALLLDSREQQMLGADVLVAHVAGLFGGILEDLLARAWTGGTSPRISPPLPLGRLFSISACISETSTLIRSSALTATPSPSFRSARMMCSGRSWSEWNRLASSCASIGEHLLCPLRQTFEHAVSLPSVA